MPFISISESPLNPDIRPVSIYYREYGAGVPLVFLHGGWGYEVYPFDAQISALQDRFRILIPDRSGYGKSMSIAEQPVDFHSGAAIETLRLLDALDIDRAAFWGHSDGAVIAALIGLAAPSRAIGLIFEAFHFYRNKPRSRAFFEAMQANPESIGSRASAVLAREHGGAYWRELIVNNGRAWLQIADQSSRPDEDLYEGRLGELRVPAIFIHGAQDPRTEPGELAAVECELPSKPIHLIEQGGHSPHSESAAREECTRIAKDFLRELLKQE